MSNNSAAMREALGKLRAELWNNAIISGKRKFKLYEIADAALAAPPRNCDVGTAEEQGRRCRETFAAWRDKFQNNTLIVAILKWAQMPYTE